MSKMIEDGGPAFAMGLIPHPTDPTKAVPASNLSVRDWFAGQFVSRFSASDLEPLDVEDPTDLHEVEEALREHWGHIARAAYIAADAMLAARKAGSE